MVDDVIAGMDPEVTEVAWAILQALHANIPEADRPMSWSDVNGDQEQRIRAAAVAAIECLRARDARPHPRWRPQDGSSRHPQSAAEWDWRQDSVGDALTRSVNRLNFAMDFDDPRAPDQMTVVLRADILRLTHDWIHKNVAWEHWRQRDSVDTYDVSDA